MIKIPKRYNLIEKKTDSLNENYTKTIDSLDEFYNKGKCTKKEYSTIRKIISSYYAEAILGNFFSKGIEKIIDNTWYKPVENAFS